MQIKPIRDIILLQKTGSGEKRGKIKVEIRVDELQSLAARFLSEKRFRHTLGVADCAEDMARRFGLDTFKARCAGLVHDLAKEIPLSDQLSLARHWNLLRYPDDEQHPKLLHGPLAAHFLRHYYRLGDEEILDAVACHTLGRPGMTPLDMLIYSADWIEPNREFPGVDELRRSLYEDLEQGTFDCMRRAFIDLQEQNLPVHPLTQLAFEDMQRRRGIDTGS